MVEDQIDQHTNSAAMRFRHEALEVFIRPVLTVYLVIVRYIVAVITRRLCDGHQPDAIGAEVAHRRGVAVVDIVEPLRESREVADSVAVAVEERSDENLVADTAARKIGGARPDRLRHSAQGSEHCAIQCSCGESRDTVSKRTHY